jgi:DNA-binding MarR family transcriptional regulator
MLGSISTMESFDRTSTRIAELLPELMTLLHSVIAGETLAKMQEADLTMPQLVAMHVLHHGGATSVSELSQATRLSMSATSHLVDRLVERGYVGRSEDPNDRRQKRVELAPEGVTLLTHLVSARARELEAGFEMVDISLRRELVVVLEQAVLQLRIQLARPSSLTS